MWSVVITPTALHMLRKIADRRVREKIVERIDGLAREPDKQGKPLVGELAGCRSLRAVGQRYRIIYRLERGRVIVAVLALGLRKGGSRSDIYALARKLLKFRLV